MDDILRMGRAYAAEVAETLPHVVFDEQIMRETVQNYLDTANPTIFVADRNGQAVGILIATATTFHFMSGVCCVNDVFFVDAGQRGSRAAALLNEQFDLWADRRKAKLLVGGNSNNLYTQRTTKFYRHLGYRECGVVMLKDREQSG
jgi:GNAT superfamily N-acetyltransferase